jgi:hypothetical protein
MLELFGWDVGMSTLAAIMLVVGAVVIGGIAQFVGDVTVGWESAVTGVAALIGGYLGSEALAGASTWGPVFEGLYIAPAIIGAIVLGAAVDAVLRFGTEGSYLHHAQPI